MSYKVGFDIKKAESPVKSSQLLEIIALSVIFIAMLQTSYTVGKIIAYISMIK